MVRLGIRSVRLRPVCSSAAFSPQRNAPADLVRRRPPAFRCPGLFPGIRLGGLVFTCTRPVSCSGQDFPRRCVLLRIQQETPVKKLEKCDICHLCASVPWLCDIVPLEDGSVLFFYKNFCRASTRRPLHAYVAVCQKEWLTTFGLRAAFPIARFCHI